MAYGKKKKGKRCNKCGNLYYGKKCSCKK